MLIFQIDLISYDLQIRIFEEDEHKIDFKIKYGLHEWFAHDIWVDQYTKNLL